MLDRDPEDRLRSSVAREFRVFLAVERHVPMIGRPHPFGILGVKRDQNQSITGVVERSYLAFRRLAGRVRGFRDVERPCPDDGLSFFLCGWARGPSATQR